MNHRERFAAVMDYRPADRLPAYYFGTWGETLERWRAEGLRSADAPDAEVGLDPDWEAGMWQCHGLADCSAMSDRPAEVLDEGPDWRLRRTPLGAVLRERKDGGSIPQHVEEALKPTRAAWREFKRFLDPADPRRRAKDWAARVAALNRRERVATFIGGSLFAGPREWMGLQALSYLSYDDPALYEEIIDYIADFHMEMAGPVLREVRFEFVYFFEDCCGRSGPLFSPDTYRRVYHRRYERMIRFYRDSGVPHALIDSDGDVSLLIPCWMESGFDILFPVEVGSWRADPVAIRRKHGRALRMMGGVNKHVIPRGEAAVRRELEALRPAVEDGGFIPLPDHRIPPDCSLEQFRTYVRVFREMFGGQVSPGG